MKPQQSAAGRSTGLSFTSRSFGKVNVITGAYQHGGKLAVELVADSGEDIATLSVNMAECSQLLGDGEFFAKTWSENEEIAADALASGILHCFQQFTDPATGTVNGVCQQQVDGAVTVYDENGKTMVIVKSKLDVNENSMVIETGDRQNCINHIVDEMKTLGCALTPQTPAG